ncbi:MAG: maleylpyruvate isomerase N-terminal domain-containing protein [Acidimicrobiia bacterium]
MTDIRALFCDAAAAAAPLVADPALKERFDGPSALAEFSVRGLAGHLLRAMTSVDGYLDRPAPDAIASGEAGEAPRVSAAEYYASVLAGETDINSDFHRSIRQRGLEAAPEAPEAFPGAWAKMTARLQARLPAEPADRLVQVYGDLVLTLDDYLVTRLIELVVHADDLAVSLGVDPPLLPAAATCLVITTLVEVARVLHGDIAVVRALARRERDAVGALRVI